MIDDCFQYMLEMFEDSSLFLIVINPSNMNIVNINRAGANFYGYDREELIGESYYKLMHNNGSKSDELLFDQNGDKANSFSNIFEHITHTGEIKEVEIITIKSFAQNMPLWLLFVYDRTELLTVSRRLNESELKFQKLLRDIPSVSVQGYYMDGTTFYWNKASEEIYGYTEEEALGKNLLDLIIPENIAVGVKESIEQSARTGVPPEASELQLRNKDGLIVDVFSSHAILAFEKKPLEMFCIDIDISERKIARQLRLAANVFTHAVEPILITDHQANIIDVNQRFIDIFGYEKKEVYGKNPNISKSGLHDNAHYKKMWIELLNNGSWTGEVYNRKKSGEILPMLIRINAVKDAKNQIQNYICFML